MARPKKQKIKEKIVYPDVPFKAMLVEEPNVQNSLAINSVYDIVFVYRDWERLLCCFTRYSWNNPRNLLSC